MLKKLKITTKLYLAVSFILAAIIVLNGYYNARSDRIHFINLTLENALLTSEVIKHNLDAYMMEKDYEDIENVIAYITDTQEDIEKIRLIDQEGIVKVSSMRGEIDHELNIESGVCLHCHESDIPLGHVPKKKLYTIAQSPFNGHEVLTVVTPVYNSETCSNAPCHFHSAEQNVLGLIQTDYSLENMKEVLENRRRDTGIAAVVAIIIFLLVTGILMSTAISKPVWSLLRGMMRVAEGDLTYRYQVKTDDEIGHIGNMFNYMVDELEEKTTELRKTSERLTGIIESSGDIILTISEDGTIDSVNRAGTDILGYSKEELIGRDADILFNESSDRIEIFNDLRSVGGVVRVETRLRKKDGSNLHTLLAISDLRSTKGEIEGSICVISDITEMKELQNKLIQSERLAAVGTAITSISHGAKNILHNLKGGSYLMRMGFSKEKMSLLKEGWEVVELGISKLSNMAMDMLNYTREQQLSFGYCSLNDVVGDVCDMVLQTAQTEGVSIEWDLSPNLPMIAADPDAINTVLMNIVSNAVESCAEKEYESGESPGVRIRTFHEPDSGFVEIEICDNGIGISEDVITKIFTPFFSTKVERGTGLGLGISNKIVKAHKGLLDVISQEGKGAVFNIILPLKQR